MRYHHVDEIAHALEMLKSNEVIRGLILITDDLPQLWHDFTTQFKKIEAAGGLVQNDRGESLMIFRNEKWDLPKGKLEKGETIEEGALREVEEECGVEDLRLGNHIVDTYHVYPYKGNEVLKRTYWYEMQSNQLEFVPQEEEGITRVLWMKIDSDVLDNLDTYPNIKLVFKSGMD